jgi:hypothetical protein
VTFWQVLVVIAIVIIPLAAAVVVTLWTVPRPGSRPPQPPNPAASAELPDPNRADATDSTTGQP